jgi:hypothetical protein
MDIGGFSVPSRFSAQKPKPEDAEEWRELNARWFEFGTFVPLLRVHGEYPKREMWELGGEKHPAYQAELKFDRIRYRLLPYLYSLAGAVGTPPAPPTTAPPTPVFPPPPMTAPPTPGAPPGPIAAPPAAVLPPALVMAPIPSRPPKLADQVATGLDIPEVEWVRQRLDSCGMLRK